MGAGGGGGRGGKNRGNQTHAAAVMRACVGCLLYLGVWHRDGGRFGAV